MSRGLGVRQVEIKAILTVLWRRKLPTRFCDIYALAFAASDDEEGDKLAPAFVRSMWRALRTLIARGEVMVVFGGRNSRNPRHFMTVEDFAKLSGKKVRDTAHAKAIAADASRQVVEMVVMQARLDAAARSRRAAARR
jgi:hypothetical protein